MRIRSRLRRVLATAAVSIVGLVILAGAASAQNIGVFISSESTIGEIMEPGFVTGITSADAICNRLGTAAFPGSGPWVAWLSVDQPQVSVPPVNARDRIAQPGPGGAYVRAAQPGTVIADDLSDLADGSLDNAICFEESGGPAGCVTDEVWTGTDQFGFRVPNNDCLGWIRDGAAGDQGQFGLPYAAIGQWTDAGFTNCAATYRLYCLGPLPGEVPTLGPRGAVILALVLLVLGVLGAQASNRQRSV